MAKQLLLVRHGKSDKDIPHVKDFDRPLNHRGNKNAHTMAEKLLEKGWTAPLLVSSPANRALSTAVHFAKVFNIPEEAIKTDLSIYEANTMALLKVVNGFPNQSEVIALFGHNPGITDFANYLTDADIYNIPTSGIVVINFDVSDWAEVSYHTGTMLLFDFPKNTDDSH
jgi:phosphohistidine phosphatase